MKKSGIKKAKKTAVCGMASALSVVLMLFTAVLPFLMYVLPIVTGILILFIAELTDKKWALGVYLSTAILSMLLLTDKETALTYTLFFGYYPLIKESFEKLPKVASWILKFILFNAAAVSIGYLGVALFGVSGEEYQEFGKLTIPLLLGMANIVFVLYDIMQTKYKILFLQLAKRFWKIIG